MATEHEIRALINEVESVETLRQIFKDIADALRRKGVAPSDKIHPEEYADIIDRIKTNDGFTDTSDATATSADILLNKTAYAKNQKLIGTIPTVDEAIPKITTSGQYIVVTTSQPKGYVQGINREINTKASELDSNLVASNIRNGVSIFGVAGSMQSGTDTSSATATASDIAYGKTAYGANGKITGNVSTISSGSKISPSIPSPSLYVSGVSLYVDTTLPYDSLMRLGSIFSTYTALSNLGNATAADVAAGKTFTSSAGLKVAGTMVIPPSFASKTIQSTQGTVLSTLSGALELDVSQYEYIVGFETNGYFPATAGKTTAFIQAFLIKKPRGSKNGTGATMYMILAVPTTNTGSTSAIIKYDVESLSSTSATFSTNLYINTSAFNVLNVDMVYWTGYDYQLFFLS